MSPTERCGHIRFSFPDGQDPYLVLDGYTKQSQVKIDVENNTITGYVHNGMLVPGPYKNYFSMKFDTPFKAFGTWKKQHRIREVMSKLYNATENGYPGDEDQGGLSSWYVLSALGIYSVCPGTDQYVLGSPMFEKTSVTLENGNVFVIEAKNNSSENVYIQSAKLNGKEITRNWITYGEIVAGGKLQFEMGNKPNLKRK